MSATFVTIKDTKQAIEDGTIPGKFTSDKLTFEFPILKYANTRTKKIAHWGISIKLLNNLEDTYINLEDKLGDKLQDKMFKSEITVKSGLVDGKIRTIVPTYITEGKNIGKVNETNVITQAFRDALGMYNKKQKSVSTGEVDLTPPPMLVKNIKDVKLMPTDFELGITVQRKFNGVHYVTAGLGRQPLGRDGSGDDGGDGGGGGGKDGKDGKDGGNKFQVIRYSRNGLRYPEESTPYLTEEIRQFMKYCPKLPERPYFAGELYKHGISLNKISGQARRASTNIATEKLEYHIFDVFFPYSDGQMKSRDRQQYLAETFEAIAATATITSIKKVENFKVSTIEEISELSRRFISEGYEGAIARKDEAIYQYSVNNYHSSNIVKIKPTFDAEFPIVSFTQGEKGKDKGALIWICGVENIDSLTNVATKKTFNVVPKQTYKERYELFTKLNTNLNEFEKYKGKLLTVQYAELSPNGIPLQPKGVIIRDYE